MHWHMQALRDNAETSKNIQLRRSQIINLHSA